MKASLSLTVLELSVGVTDNCHAERCAKARLSLQERLKQLRVLGDDTQGIHAGPFSDKTAEGQRAYGLGTSTVFPQNIGTQQLALW